MDIFQIIRLKEIYNYKLNIDKVDLTIIDEYGHSLLHEAIAYEHNDIAKDLIIRGININIQDNKGVTPLYSATSHQNYELVKLILENNGNVHLKTIDGNSPIFAAVVHPKRNMQIVQLLMQYGAYPQEINRYGNSPFSIAKEIGNEILLDILLKKKK